MPLSPGDGTLGLRMTKPASEGEVAGYLVQWKRVGDSWDTPADVFEETVSRMTHTITGLTGGSVRGLSAYSITSQSRLARPSKSPACSANGSLEFAMVIIVMPLKCESDTFAQSFTPGM